MKRVILCYFLLLLNNASFGQNYIDYQRIFNRIDEDILSENYQAALKRLDSIYTNYDFIYAKHCIKALQISITANDSVNADRWLAKCFKQGIPLWIIRTNEITNKSLRYSTTRKTLRNFDSLHAIHISSIDTILRNTIDSLLSIDQKYTRKVNDGFVLFKPIYWLQWGIYNKRQLTLLKDIIVKYGYPEEKLIGLPLSEDSAAFAAHFSFWGPSELRNSRVQIMIQHCFSTWHEIDCDFKNTLYENLCNGNMPAFQYAILIHMMTPDKTKHLNCKYWTSSDLCDGNCREIIDKNRSAIGLNSIEQENKITLIERERRKKKKANSEIMLE